MTTDPLHRHQGRAEALCIFASWSQREYPSIFPGAAPADVLSVGPRSPRSKEFRRMTNPQLRLMSPYQRRRRPRQRASVFVIPTKAGMTIGLTISQSARNAKLMDRQRKSKPAAFADFALHPNLAAVHFHKPSSQT